MITCNGRCTNFNHGRTNTPVQCCPMCGEGLNSKIPQKVCSEEKHAKTDVTETFTVWIAASSSFRGCDQRAGGLRGRAYG